MATTRMIHCCLDIRGGIKGEIQEEVRRKAAEGNVMANVRKYGYYKPAKPNSRAWCYKRRARTREGKPRKEKTHGQTCK